MGYYLSTVDGNGNTFDMTFTTFSRAMEILYEQLRSDTIDFVSFQMSIEEKDGLRVIMAGWKDVNNL